MPLPNRITTSPGEVLNEEFLKPLGLSARALAEILDIAHTRITELVNGNRGMTADTAHRLSRYFGTTPHVWMNLQDNYELSKAFAEHEREYSRIKSRETESA